MDIILTVETQDKLHFKTALFIAIFFLINVHFMRVFKTTPPYNCLFQLCKEDKLHDINY